jgi:enamine deaminase RidA (YjgF/YER057c/UK114 family)
MHDDLSRARQQYSTGTRWEAEVGYSRAVRVGQRVYVAGTTATDDAGAVVGMGDAYTQAAYILAKIGRSLEAVGASLDDVVRTRMFVTDISQWPAVGRAHGEVFGHIRPAATMVEVSRLIDPAHLVEIEVEAEITSGVTP